MKIHYPNPNPKNQKTQVCGAGLEKEAASPEKLDKLIDKLLQRVPAWYQ